MMTRGMKIRRQLRSARVSALTEDERRAEMRQAEERAAAGQQAAVDGREREDAGATVVPPHAAGPCQTPGPT
jgi:hypothetical protein